MKILKYIASLALVLVLSYGFRALIPPTEVTSPSSSPSVVSSSLPTTFPVPTQVQPIVTKLGINPIEVRKIQIFVPGTTAKCDGVLANGVAVACYFNGEPPSIYMPSSTLTSKDATATFAHEYMHYVWSNLVTDAEKTTLTASIEKFYQANRRVVEPRFKSYVDSGVSGARLTDEKQATFCTEISDWRLPADFRAYCIRHLPNRNALPSFY